MAQGEIKLSTLKPVEKNPRKISRENMEKLIQSLREFPQMMELRPIIVDEDNNILAGLQRKYALMEMGYKTIPRAWVVKAKDLTQEQKDRFMAADNHHFGEWDYDVLATKWSLPTLSGWGISIAKPAEAAAVSFKAKTRDKDTLLKIQCASKDEAIRLQKELTDRGYNVEIK